MLQELKSARYFSRKTKRMNVYRFPFASLHIYDSDFSFFRYMFKNNSFPFLSADILHFCHGSHPNNLQTRVMVKLTTLYHLTRDHVTTNRYGFRWNILMSDKLKSDNDDVLKKQNDKRGLRKFTYIRKSCEDKETKNSTQVNALQAIINK